METLIVSRTRMHGNGRCIGGLTLSGARSVRLVPVHGPHWDATAPFQIGEVWSLTASDGTGLQAPHMEDVIVHAHARRVGADPEHVEAYLRSLSADLQRQGRFWTGGPDALFNGALSATDGGSGYLSTGADQRMSTGFWVPDGDLTKRTFTRGGRTRIRFYYPSHDGIRTIPYVGAADAPAVIPAGALCRMSLARWWAPDGEDEERCYLQLSGVYASASASGSSPAASHHRGDTSPSLPFGVRFEVGHPYLEQEWYKLDGWYTKRGGNQGSASDIPRLTF